MNTKILAIYLPQYYQTEYNDRWWGEGYTEWTACKKATSLFKGHVQPRVPYSEYDLSDYKAIDEQAKMARQYGIDGFAIYQYYSTGDKLLNVPTELLLEHKEIDIEFCLYWANESWESRWYGQEKKVIWEQKYGKEKEWKEHFDYCLPFFKDKRYIKIDNKPVYIIYKDWLFKDVNAYIDYWNKLAIESGFDGIYFIKTVGALNTNDLGKFNATFEREPFYTFNKRIGFFGRIRRYARTRIVEFLNKKILNKKGKGIIQYSMDYKKCSKLIANGKMPNGSATILGAFTDWDNSPRRQYNSTLFKNVTVESFEECMKAQMKKANGSNSPLVIINA